MRNKLVFILFLLIFVIGCREKISDANPSVSIKQIGKCNYNKLSKTSSDSLCFDYKFKNSLIIDFCVKGNCCPDSNRFVFESNIVEDQVLITVTDVAPNLCKCICTYTIHGEIAGLTNSSYFVTCILKNDDVTQTIHKKEVFRN